MNDYIDFLHSQRGGFNFDNYFRNDNLFQSGKFVCPPLKKTGTTICGVVCKDGVVLAADTRSTSGSIVADKNCSKLHRISDNIYCAGAGASGDLLHTILWLESYVELHRLNSDTMPRVSYVITKASQELFKYMGYKQCALVLGGFDCKGGHIYKISPHGSTDRLPYAAMGSGSLCALSVLESGYTDGMSVEDGKILVYDAISAGILNDLGSGGNVDVCTLTKDGTKHERNYVSSKILSRGVDSSRRIFRILKPVEFSIGTTPVLREKLFLKKCFKNNEDHEDTLMEG